MSDKEKPESILLWVDAAIQIITLLNTILTRLDGVGAGCTADQIRANLRALVDMKPQPPSSEEPK